VSEEELRREAVRRRMAGEIAEAVGRTTRWVRKWVARHDEGGHDEGGPSRAHGPRIGPRRAPQPGSRR